MQQTRRKFLTTIGSAVASARFPPLLQPIQSMQNESDAYPHETDNEWHDATSNSISMCAPCIAVDSHDRVYCVSMDKKCVYVLNEMGRILTTWPAPWADTCNSISISTVGQKEYICFVNTMRSIITLTNINGGIILQIGCVEVTGERSVFFPIIHPIDATLGKNGSIYIVTSSGQQCLYGFTMQGKCIVASGLHGSGVGQFYAPYGITIRHIKGNTELYIADCGNERIQVFSPTGQYKRCIVTKRSQPYRLSTLRGSLLALDTDMSVHFYDHRDMLTYSRSISNLLKNQSKDQAPYGCCWDSKANLYVACKNSCGIRKFIHANHQEL